jgi:hypothetical protein
MAAVSFNPGFKGGPGVTLQRVAKSCGLRVFVTLDGVRQRRVLFADTDAGVLIKLKLDADGKTMRNAAGDAAATEEFRGVVTFALEPEPSRVAEEGEAEAVAIDVRGP